MGCFSERFCLQVGKYGSIIGYTSPVVLLVFLILYSVSVIAFCFLVSVFFSRGQSTGQAGSGPKSFRISAKVMTSVMVSSQASQGQGKCQGQLYIVRVSAKANQGQDQGQCQSQSG